MKKNLLCMQCICILFIVLFASTQSMGQNSAVFSLGNASISGTPLSSPCSGPLTLTAGQTVSIPLVLGTTGGTISVGAVALALQWNSALTFTSATYKLDQNTSRNYFDPSIWAQTASGPTSETLKNTAGIGQTPPYGITLTFTVNTTTTINDLSTVSLLSASLSSLNTAAFTAPTPAVSYSPCSSFGTLPLKLTSFTAQQNKSNEVVLNWSAVNQVNTAAFEIERSNSGKDNWQMLGNVPAAGTNAASVDYGFADPMPKSGSNYYRLKMIDIDGGFTYSPIQSVILTNPAERERMVVWPSVTRDKIYVQGASSEVTVCVFDMTGQLLLKSKVAGPSQGISLMNLQPKLYIVQIIKEGQLATTTKVIKQ